jgi:hypothetical protein
MVPAKLSYTAVNANVPALGKTVYTLNELEWAVTKFGNGVVDAAVDVDVDADDVADDDGRGRVKYAQADNSAEPEPFPGPKVVRKAGWMGRLLLLLLIVLAAVDLVVALLDAAALSAMAAAATTGGTTADVVSAIDQEVEVVASTAAETTADGAGSLSLPCECKLPAVGRQTDRNQ